MKDGQEIKNRVAELNNLIQETLWPQYMVIDEKIGEIVKELEELQKQCPHYFVEGQCEYCGITNE